MVKEKGESEDQESNMNSPALAVAPVAAPCEVSRTTIGNYLKVPEATFVAHVIRRFSTSACCVGTLCAERNHGPAKDPRNLVLARAFSRHRFTNHPRGQRHQGRSPRSLQHYASRAWRFALGQWPRSAHPRG